MCDQHGGETHPCIIPNHRRNPLDIHDNEQIKKTRLGIIINSWCLDIPGHPKCHVHQSMKILGTQWWHFANQSPQLSEWHSGPIEQDHGVCHCLWKTYTKSCFSNCSSSAQQRFFDTNTGVTEALHCFWVPESYGFGVIGFEFAAILKILSNLCMFLLASLSCLPWTQHVCTSYILPYIELFVVMYRVPHHLVG